MPTLTPEQIEEGLRLCAKVCTRYELLDCQNRLYAALLELKALREPCVWTRHDMHRWETGCGRCWVITKTDFCPNCGHPVKVE